MSDPFTHLRVASCYSLQFGAAQPEALVKQAADYNMDMIGLTDRDGLYGAVRFAKACQAAGVSPIVGVDLAVREPWLKQRPMPRRAAAKGGEIRDPRLPRVVVSATSRAGWARLCRLVTAVHLAGERGRPVADPMAIAEAAASGDLIIMLGSDSVVGELVAAGDYDAARAELGHWGRLIPSGSLVVGVAYHHAPPSGRGSLDQAAGLLRLADQAGMTGVLVNDVRMVERRQAATVDVLDAARRLVPLDLRNIDRRSSEGFLKSTVQMAELAAQVSHAAGRGGSARLLSDTRELALRCRLDPVADIGLGETHLPEFQVLGTTDDQALGVLRGLCEAGANARYGGIGSAVRERLDDELRVIDQLGFTSYFLTVKDVVTKIHDRGIRVAARGSGAGSLVNYLLGISGVDPLKYGLVMERFLSPLRRSLPDIDLDVESARRTEIYRMVLDAFGEDRVACVAMVETYRVRHAVRDVGAALAMPPAEIDAIAKAFPHIRARNARTAIRELPELRGAGLSDQRFERFFDLVESLDGLPRHIALHPCGVLLSDVTLGDRTPMERSFEGFPMSQFDKDDVEDLGLLKLDILGIRMQSAMAHAVSEVQRVTGQGPDIDALAPFDDPNVYDMIGHSQTLGCFQIESPGQRELVGKFGPENFNDIIIDISLFRPGPMKSDMIVPFLSARQGWREPEYLHPDLKDVLAETCGVVVFHEQIIKMVSVLTGCSYAQGDEVRRALSDPDRQQEIREWFCSALSERGYDASVVERAWFVLLSFASFGFCKAHAAAFALPTYQSAWLKRYYPAAFIAGVLTHDPGMYPKRLILDEARRMNVAVCGVDVNESDRAYRVVRVGANHDDSPAALSGNSAPPRLQSGLPDGSGWGIRLSLADVKGIAEDEISRIIAGQPYRSMNDFWARAQVSVPTVERLILTGAFDSLYGIGSCARITRRDLLLALADLDRADRAGAQAGQLALPIDESQELVASGLPEMTLHERLAAELDILGMDASTHLMDEYRDFLDAMQTVGSADLLARRNHAPVLVAGVKVATQTPPVRSGHRVVFLTLDDGSGPVDATFFEDVQGSYAATIFNSWLLLVRGTTRRTGPRGISVLASGAWELAGLHSIWRQALDQGCSAEQALSEVWQAMEAPPDGRVKEAVTLAPRKLWHSSPGSAGR